MAQEFIFFFFCFGYTRTGNCFYLSSTDLERKSSVLYFFSAKKKRGIARRKKRKKNQISKSVGLGFSKSVSFLVGGDVITVPVANYKARLLMMTNFKDCDLQKIGKIVKREKAVLAIMALTRMDRR